MIQMQDLLETAELEALARIVEAGSLSRAALELGVPRATIGRRLARLEERVGVRLIRRSTRKLALTDAGTTLYHHALLALASVRDAADSVRTVDGALRGRLRVSVPPMASASFDAMVDGFLLRHPDVRIQIHSTSVHADLVTGGFDLALRASAELDPGLVARPLARSRTIAVASPEYLARRGMPRRARDLVGHACLLGFDRGEMPNHYWPLARGRTMRVDGPLATNELGGLMSAASAGLGIALLPLFLVATAIRDGALRPVLPEIVGGRVQIAVVYPDRELVPQVVRAFIDELIEWGRHAFVELNELEAKCQGHEAARRPRGRARNHAPRRVRA